MSEDSVGGVPHGTIYDDTASAFAYMFMAGVFWGGGIVTALLGYGLTEIGNPTVPIAICLLGGSAVGWLALKKLPDARTIATFVQEVDYHNE